MTTEKSDKLFLEVSHCPVLHTSVPYNHFSKIYKIHVLENLREYLQTYGDVLSDDEVKEFMDDFCPENGEILTLELVMQLMSTE